MSKFIHTSLVPWRNVMVVLAICLCIGACSGGQKEDTGENEHFSGSDKASLWADSIVKGMDEWALAKQMVMCRSLNDTLKVKVWHHDDREGFGGILLPAVLPDSLPDLKGLRDSSLYSPWIAIDLDAEWFHTQGMPQMIRLGAVGDPLLHDAWGKGIGSAYQSAGANMVFLSAGRLIMEHANDPDALGADAARVLKQSLVVLTALRSTGMMPVVRPLPAVPMGTFSGDKGQLLSYLLPYQFLCKGDSLMGQVSLFHAPALDKIPAPHSPKITTILRHSDRQVLFSPVIHGDSPDMVAQSALKCLQSGQDMVVLERHGLAVAKSIKEAILEGSLPLQAARKKVHRILSAKYAHKAWKRNSSMASIPGSQAMSALSNWVRESSISIVRDNRRLLPLKGGLSNLETAILLAPGTKYGALLDELGVYGNAKTIAWDTSRTAHAALIKAIASYDLVVVPFSKQMGKESAHAQPAFLNKLLLHKAQNLCVVNFGPVSGLGGMENFDLVIQAWEDAPAEQRAVAKLLVGGLDAEASMPLQCGPLFCTGDGVRRQGSMRLTYTLPEMAGAYSLVLQKIDRIVNEAIQEGAFPGCQVLAAKDGRVFFHKGYGHHDYSRSDPVQLSDLYDLASVTKIAATTLMAMRLIETDTAFQLDKPLRRYLPEVDSSFITIKDITPRELLTHRAGLPAGLPIYSTCVLNDSLPEVRARAYADGTDSLHQVCVTPSLFLNGNYLDSLWLLVRRTHLDSVKVFRYSDMSMFLLQRVLERLAGCTLDRFMDSVFYQPMGLQTLGFLPANKFSLDRITPTENDMWWRNQLVHGSVHDPSAAMFGGVGGQAGLFSNAWDLAALMHLLLNDGSYAGYRFLQPQTIQSFIARQPGLHRGLGFDMQRSAPVPGEGMVAWAAHPNTFGHLGFTGTCAWADPENQIIFVFLSNRVHPDAQNKRINQMRIRQRVQDVVYEALGLIPPPEQMGCYLE